jgi:hypothetical protein
MARKPRIKNRVRWYGVKSVYRSFANGRPRAVDSSFDPRVTMVEERIVLFKARTFAEAIRAAEAEAREYAKSRHVNPFGQQVRVRYLRAVDAFELFDSPRHRGEVFSTTELVPKRVADREVVDRRIGPTEPQAESRKRRNFLDRDCAASVTRGV